MIAFGPIPSRRLGQSLGINNIPPKSCSYDCIYCQVGVTTRKELERREFYTPEKILEDVQQRIKEVKVSGGTIDYLSFVPDGEPTLDIHLGKAIELLRPLGHKIAVFTNASLLWRKDVRKELALADFVSVKMDAVEERPWRRVNRPKPDLDLEEILLGALDFSREFKGTLATETMVVKSANDGIDHLQATAKFLEKLSPDIAFIAIPTRPPAESWAHAPDEDILNSAYQVFSKHVRTVELLTGFPETSFAASGDVVSSMLDITTVHPMREGEALKFLKQGGFGKEAGSSSALNNL